MAFQSGRRGGSGPGRGQRRTPGGPDVDPLNPDVVPGPPEDDPGDPESVAQGLCLRSLTGAPKTRQQLAELLAARAWVSSRQAGRGLARRALAAELRAKGVDAEVAAEAVETVGDEDERETARRLVDRKVGAMRRLDRATATRRLMGLLARKGYNGGLAAAVVREALDGARSGDDEFDALDEDALLP